MVKSIIALMLASAAVVSAQTRWWEDEQSAKAALEERTIAEDYKSRVNWENGYLEVTAGGTCNVERAKSKAQCYAMALKTARHLAFEKLAEIIYGVRIDADNLFANEVHQDVQLKSSTEGLIKGAREVAMERTEFEDGSVWVEMTVGIVLTGEKGLSSAVVPWLQRRTQAAAPKLFTVGDSAPSDVPPASGLIVDASGLGVKPTMAPRVLVQGRDEELYGRVNMDRAAAVRFGVVGYTDTVAKATALKERVGESPLVVRAVATGGAYSADVLLSTDDAARVVAANMKSDFLKECRVVFVVG
ncbi:hypothetical protein JXA88_09780 [Candidatus Fermentibacteria bacterium]|nr:hypothetical protein [Candidatus Fermentibacteria bacterium]